MAKNKIKRTQSMMIFLLLHKTPFMGDLKSLMEGKDRLSERTLMTGVTDKLLSKAEEAFYSFTELMSNKVVKVISRYRIFLFKTRR